MSFYTNLKICESKVMSIKKKLGLNIREIRKAKNFTQEFIAQKVAIETKSLSNIE